MTPHDRGINNHLDRLLKSLADQAPHLILELLGMAPKGKTKILPLRPETAPTAVFPDYVAVLKVKSASPFIFHVEFQLIYSGRVPRTMARYGGSLAWQYRRRVVSVLLLLKQKGAPKVVPDFGEYKIGDTVTRHPFEVVRLWEIDPTPLLASNRTELFPWALMMNATEEQGRRIAQTVRERGDETALALFYALGGVRYDREQLDEMLGGPKMGLVEAIVQGSSLFRDARREARKEGRKAGKKEGVIDGARQMLRRFLRDRFTGLETLPEVDQINDLDVLATLASAAAEPGRDRASMKRAILAAARGK